MVNGSIVGERGCLPVLIFTILVVTLAIVATCEVSNRRRNEAIKAGVAEYYLDENHNKQFRWKQQKASEE